MLIAVLEARNKTPSARWPNAEIAVVRSGVSVEPHFSSPEPTHAARKFGEEQLTVIGPSTRALTKCTGRLGFDKRREVRLICNGWHISAQDAARTNVHSFCGRITSRRVIVPGISAYSNGNILLNIRCCQSSYVSLRG